MTELGGGTRVANGYQSWIASFIGGAAYLALPGDRHDAISANSPMCGRNRFSV